MRKTDDNDLAKTIEHLLDLVEDGWAHDRRLFNFQHAICKPCSVTGGIDFIVKLETFDQDFKYLTSLLNLTVGGQIQYA